MGYDEYRPPSGGGGAAVVLAVTLVVVLLFIGVAGVGLLRWKTQSEVSIARQQKAAAQADANAAVARAAVEQLVATAVDPENEPIEMWVNSKGQISLQKVAPNALPADSDVITPHELGSVLQGLAQSGISLAAVKVFVHDDCPFRHVAAVQAACRKMNVEELQFESYGEFGVSEDAGSAADGKAGADAPMP